MTFNTTVECPRCHGGGTEEMLLTNDAGENVIVDVNCTLCEGQKWVSKNEARDYLAGMEG